MQKYFSYKYTFFSFNTPTGQTPWGIFTRDGSNDAASGKVWNLSRFKNLKLIFNVFIQKIYNGETGEIERERGERKLYSIQISQNRLTKQTTTKRKSVAAY